MTNRNNSKRGMKLRQTCRARASPYLILKMMTNWEPLTLVSSVIMLFNMLVTSLSVITSKTTKSPRRKRRRLLREQPFLLWTSQVLNAALSSSKSALSACLTLQMAFSCLVAMVASVMSVRCKCSRRQSQLVSLRIAIYVVLASNRCLR